MIWWVLAAAVLVAVGLVYVIRHESDLCAEHPDDRSSSPDRAISEATPWRKAA